MTRLNVATAQFENRSGDKNYNLGAIERLAQRAKHEGADAVAFHECSVTGYTFTRRLSREQMLDLAEPIPMPEAPVQGATRARHTGARSRSQLEQGPSIRRLTEIAGAHDIAVLAGLFERDAENHLYKAYVCVDKTGLVAKYRKLHPFINPHLLPGNEYVVFDLHGWKCGILICYDNNVIENVRATTLLGAEIIFMPHVTMGTPSPRPGAGFVDPKLWENRVDDPTSLRLEFDGMKGRSWLMKWLPARAYDNGIYVVFSNPIGMDDDQLKNGCSMIIDPFGDVIGECRKLGDDVALGLCTRDKLENAGGSRYRNARRPELYREILGRAHTPEQKVTWMADPSKDEPSREE